MHRFSVLLVVVILVMSSGVVSATNSPSTPTEPNQDDTILVEYTLIPEETYDTHLVRVSVNLPSELTQFKFDVSSPPDGFEITSQNGFNQDDNRINWDEATQTPSFTYRTNTSQSGRHGLESTSDDKWAFITGTHLTFPFNYTYRGSEPKWQEEISLNGEGYAGPSIGFMGKASTFDSDDNSIRLILPDAATEVDDPSRIVTTLNESRDVLRVGNEPQHLNVFVAPTPIRRGGLSPYARISGETDIWVNEEMSLLSSNNVWIHEFTHSRQQFDLDSDMQWFVEGSAEYYATLISLYQNHISFEQFHRTITIEQASGALSNQGAWTANTPYNQGGHFLAALDGRIRTDTNHSSSLVDIFAQMNLYNKSISSSEFQRMVVDETGNESLSDWIHRYTTTDEIPTIPDDSARYVQTHDKDSDGDGLSDSKESSLGTHPFKIDTDEDGLNDGEELYEYGTSPVTALTDNDAFSDEVELTIGTPPTRVTQTHDFIWQAMTAGQIHRLAS